ncbi:condensation domain-containing protein, partial [Streptomyces flaveolus]|uniref:condensation domain-containing protein n=1 Tax=Streptomyces flaveolus TaxID=67297 RepID=UPI0034296D4F
MPDTSWKPLTAAQEDIFYAHEIDPANPNQNIAEYLVLRGNLRIPLLERAVRRTLAETESSRLVFRHDDAGPRQSVLPVSEFRLPVIDVRGETDPLRSALRWMRADMRRPVDLRRGPLFSLAVLRTAAEESVLHLRAHHIATDHSGYRMWLHRVAEVYTALDLGHAVPSAPVVPLDAILADDAAYRAGERCREDRDFWADRLARAPEVTTLTGRSAPASASAHHRTGLVPADTLRSLRALARTSGVALPALLVAATGVYVHRMAGTGNPVLGLGVAARRGSTVREAIT